MSEKWRYDMARKIWSMCWPEQDEKKKAEVVSYIANVLEAEADYATAKAVKICEDKMYDYGCASGSEVQEFVELCHILATEIRSGDQGSPRRDATYAPNHVGVVVNDPALEELPTHLRQFQNARS